MTDNARVSPDCHGKNKPMPSLNTMETLFRTVIGLKQREGLLRAGYCVAEALIKILGKAAIGAIVGEFLDIAQSAADFIPVPGLKAAAGALISVWEAVKLVTVNQAACFRLTERCATILISVHEEVVKAGSEAFVGLQDVLDRLIQSYHNVHVLFGEYAQFSFLKRYILRKDIERDLLEHQLRLNDILKVFTASVVVRIYHLCKRNTELVERFVRESPGETGFAKMKLAPPSPTSVSSPVDSTPGITGIAGLREYLLSQDDADHEADLGVLRSRVQEAAEARDDHKIIELIGVDRTWWTPAIRSLTQLDTVPEVEDEELPTATKTPIISSGVHAGAQRPFTRSARAKQLDAQVTRLHADFVRNSEGALRRLSGTENNSDSTVLPRSWTITNLEVLRQESIGTGAAAEVFKGVWKGYLVAIKQLADTPTLTKAVFEHEAKMWMNLKHSNVLRLFGATSTDDPMPWFFVCPYYKNGNLITFLREPRRKLEFINILKMVIEIARGMEYLHSKSIVHGDLKGANVLVGEDERCIISDFGVSQFRTCAKGDHREQCNFGSPPQWKAPELFDDNYVPSYQTDVYAFAITCIEVIQKGELPWPIGMDDERVRQSVLEGSRPTLPSTFQHRVWWGPFRELVGSCWSHSPSERPLFTPIVRNLDDFQLGYIREQETPSLTRSGSKLASLPSTLPTPESRYHAHSPRSRRSSLSHSSGAHDYDSDVKLSRTTSLSSLPQAGLPSPPHVSEMEKQFIHTACVDGAKVSARILGSHSDDIPVELRKMLPSHDILQADPKVDAFKEHARLLIMMCKALFKIQHEEMDCAHFTSRCVKAVLDACDQIAEDQGGSYIARTDNFRPPLKDLANALLDACKILDRKTHYFRGSRFIGGSSVSDMRKVEDRIDNALRNIRTTCASACSLN